MNQNHMEELPCRNDPQKKGSVPSVTVDGSEILHHLGGINPVNNGMHYLSTGARFLPSEVKVGIPQSLQVFFRFSSFLFFSFH